MQKRAAFLARVSTERQREDATIESQIAEIKQRIAENGDILVEECQYIDEGYTGELLSRPALDKMRDAAKRRLFEVLYVYDRGRLSRKFAHQEIIIDELADLGIAFITLHDAKAETPEERILQSMQGVFHEYERMKIVERFRRGKLFKVKSGKLLGYQAPYGYRYIRKTEDEDGFFEVYEDEASVVRQIFALSTSGMTVRGIALWLMENGISPQRAKRPTWSPATINDVLRDETYIGIHYYNKSEAVVAKQRRSPQAYQRVKRTSTRRRPREEWLPVAVPPIVDKETFEKVAKRRRMNAQFAQRNTKHEYLLTSLIWCPCGFRLGGETSRGVSYYRSRGKFAAFPFENTCKCKGIRCDDLDAAVWSAVVRTLSDPDLVRSHAGKWLATQAYNRTENGRNYETAKHAQNELIKLQEEEKRYALAFGQGVMSFETYQGVMKNMTERKSRLEIEMSRRASVPETPQPSLNELVDSAMAMLSTLDYSDKRRILTELVKKVVATRAEATVMLEVSLPIKNVGLCRQYNDAVNAILPFEIQVQLPERASMAGRGKASARVKRRHEHSDAEGAILHFEVKVRLPEKIGREIKAKSRA